MKQPNKTKHVLLPMRQNKTYKNWISNNKKGFKVLGTCVHKAMLVYQLHGKSIPLSDPLPILQSGVV